MKRIFLIIFSLLIINFPALAAPPTDQSYPYKAKISLMDAFSSSPCESGDIQGAIADERNTIWCIPKTSKPPAKITGKCDAGLKPIKIPDQEIFWCIPTTETIEGGGVSNLQCPKPSVTIFNKDGSVAYCSRPITKENPCSVNDKLYDESDKLTGCRMEPTSTRLNTTSPGTGKIGGTVREYTTQVPIPCDPRFGSCPSAQTPAGYIARLYQFGLMIAGLLAFGGIVYGSVKYILSAGNVTSQQDAKDQITQAILGLVLLLGAFIILYTINPSLVNLKNPQLEFINIEAIRREAQSETGGEQNLFTASPSTEENSLCKLTMNAQIDVNESANLQNRLPDIEPLIDLSKTQLLSGTQKASFCLSCKDNSSKDSNGTCVCNLGFANLNGECVKQ